MYTCTSTHVDDRSTLPRLLELYVSGQITETSWSRLMGVFDDHTLSKPEREALATFYSQAVGELGPDKVNMPKPHETLDLLTETRLTDMPVS